MGIRNAIDDKARQFMDATDAQAKAEFIQKVMKWEEVDYETAFYIVSGRTDPREPEYTLGYKMASPVWMDAMFGQLSKKKREMARDNFRKLLEEDELQLFNDYVQKNDVSKEYKAAKKEEKKRKGVNDA